MTDARETFDGEFVANGRLTDDSMSTAEALLEMQDTLDGLENETEEPPPWLTREEAIELIRQDIEKTKKGLES